jgi:hypothetical protein
MGEFRWKDGRAQARVGNKKRGLRMDRKAKCEDEEDEEQEEEINVASLAFLRSKAAVNRTQSRRFAFAGQRALGLPTAGRGSSSVV